jgi:hypothetical protein
MIPIAGPAVLALSLVAAALVPANLPRATW